MDYVDLYQIHRWDDRAPIEETLEALHDVVKAGKVRYIGASSMYAWQFATALQVATRHGWTRFVTMQNHVNLLYREEEREMLPLCRAEGIGVHSVEPAGARPADAGLAGADDAGGDRRGRQAVSIRPPSTPIAPSSTRSPRSRRRELCRAPRSRWPGSSRQRGITAPIIGASRLGHLDDAMAALSLCASRRRRCATLEAPYVPHPVSGLL